MSEPGDWSQRRPITAGVRRAGVLAAGLLAVMLAQDLVLTVISLIGSVSYAGQGLTYVGTIVGQSASDAILTDVPFAGGVFLCLWQLAPVDAFLRLPRVVTRSLLAAGAGALAAFGIGALVNIARVLAGGIEFAYTRGLGGGPSGDVVGAVFIAVQSTADAFVSIAPVVVLGGVLLWLWTRRMDGPRV